MYFEAYLRGRNGPPSIQLQNYSQGYPQPNKTPMPKAPTQTTLVFNKQYPTFNQSRIDTNRPNSSANLVINDFRKVGQQQKSPIGTVNNRTDHNFINNYVPYKNRFPITDEQKYICNSPNKNSTFRTSADCGDEISQFRFDYRRNSETIPNQKNETMRQNSVNLGYTRRTIQYLPSQTKITNISSQQYYNNPSFQQSRNKILKKQSVDTVLLSGYRQESEKQPFILRKSSMNHHYDTLNQNKINQTLQLDIQKRKPGYKAYEERAKNTDSSVLNTATPDLKRDLSQDYLSKYSISKLPNLDKTLNKDIELLNLNQLFEQKAVKNDEKSYEMKDKKEIAAKNILFQREIEEKSKELTQKNRELLQKNKELYEKSKTIIEKNKQIEELTTQIKGLKHSSNIKQQYYGWKQLQQQLRSKIKLVETELTQKDKIIQQNIYKIDNCNIKIIALEKQYSQSQQQHRNDQQKRNELASEINNLRIEKEVLERHYNQLQRNGKGLHLENQNLKDQNQKLQKNIEILHRIINESKTQKECLKNQISNLLRKEEMSQMEQNKQEQLSEKIKVMAQSKNKVIIELQEQKKCRQDNLNQLNQAFTELKQESILQKKEIQSINSYVQDLQQKYDQIGNLLLFGQKYTHEKLVKKIKECTKSAKNDDNLKDIQKIQQCQTQKENLQRKYQEMSRQFKKIGSRLACVTIQAQHGWRILTELNHQIIAINLRYLNEKYRQDGENL